MPVIKDIELPDSSDYSSLVVLNNKENLKKVIEDWSKLTKDPKFRIFFVNPCVNKRWIIYPYTHNRITEKSALKPGLNALFESVESINEKEARLCF